MANQVLRPQASAGRLGIKISTFYDHISRGILPATIKFGPRAVGHPSSEIEAIMNARTAGQSEDEIKQLVLDLTAARTAGATQDAIKRPVVDLTAARQRPN